MSNYCPDCDCPDCCSEHECEKCDWVCPGCQRRYCWLGNFPMVLLLDYDATLRHGYDDDDGPIANRTGGAYSIELEFCDPECHAAWAARLNANLSIMVRAVLNNLQTATTEGR